MGDVWKFGKIQKIFSSGAVLVLSVRLPGKTIYLGIGRGGDSCGIWNLSTNVPSVLRIVRDRFLEFFRSNINGNSIVNVSVDSKDRVVKIELFDGSLLLLFWKGHALYFSFGKKDGDVFKVFQPWKNSKVEILKQFDVDIFDEIGRREMDEKEISKDFYKEKIDLFCDPQNVVRVDNKRAKRKVKNIEEDLNRCLRWREIQSLIEKEDLNLDAREFIFKEFKVKFETLDNFYQRRDKIYIKIKKLKTGEKILRKRLEDAKYSLENKKEEIAEQKIALPVWNTQRELKTNEKSQDKNIEIFEISNHKFGRGKNSEGNDILRSRWANKSDIWVHLDGITSAHVIIKGENATNIENIRIAASIVADGSNYNGEQIPIIYTQVKDLKGVKGASGLVTYKKEKHLKISKINWKEIISNTWLE